MTGTAEMAAKLAAYVADDLLPALDYRGDYSLESLHDVDALIEENSENGQPTPDGVLTGATDRRLVCLGCYVGEVLIRAFGGSWNGEVEENTINGWMHMGIVVGGVIAHPVGKVFKRFRYGSQDSVYGLGVLLAGLTGGEAPSPPKPKKPKKGTGRKRPRG